MKNRIGKTMYWCSKCNKWTCNHGTDGHKNKDELDGARNASANIALVSFDHHPAAYKLNGPRDFNGYNTPDTCFCLGSFAGRSSSHSWRFASPLDPNKNENEELDGLDTYNIIRTKPNNQKHNTTDTTT